MNKIEQLKQALWYAKERDMAWEAVDAFEAAMPVLEEAVEALERCLDEATLPTTTRAFAEHVLDKLT